MSNMFNNYPGPTPDNRRFCLPRDILTIMAGETTEHSFEFFNMDLSDDSFASDFKLIYKLGLEVVLEKSKDKCTIVYDGHKSIVTCVLSETETSLFANTLLDAFVQFKFNVSDGTTRYSDIMEIKLEDALDSKKGD